MSDIVFSPKYKPLFLPPRVRYRLITGGRGSGKSFAESSSLCLNTYDDSYNILFTRYTMESAKISIIPEFQEKLDRLAITRHFEIREADIANRKTSGLILFRGLKTSSGNQVAKLKSIQGVKRWVLDEAQELNDESMFDTIDLSVRQKGADNLIELVLNPTDVNSWIYRRFYKGHGIEPGFCGIVDGVEYIHTTYLDNLYNLDESFIDRANRMREKDYDKYLNIFMGHWTLRSAGRIFSGWNRVTDADWPYLLPFWYGVDWGYANDPTAVIRIAYDAMTKTVWLKEVCYQKGLQAYDVAHIIARDIQDCGSTISGKFVYCDPARPEHIAELRKGGLDAVLANNRNKAGRVDFMKGFPVNYIGDNIRAEYDTYSYKPSALDKSTYTNEPADGNDHAMDAANYGMVTHLRRLGIDNALGER